MALFCFQMKVLTLVLFFVYRDVNGTAFTLVNKCDFTVWPGILAGAASSKLETTGFELGSGDSRSFPAPDGWSGRFWGRTGCNFDEQGDCGSGQVECNGAGAIPPATLAEFTIGSATAGTQDFYDVSMVDGYNLPVIVDTTGGTGNCGTTGCTTDLNRMCPQELKAEGGAACKSACGAFGTPEFCCSGVYGSPDTCKPSEYSLVFKTACPKSYSYAYDDASSTFTCSNADYTITFCPNSHSLKSSINPPPSSKGSLLGTALTDLATGESSRTNLRHSLITFVISFLLSFFLYIL